MVTTTTDQTGGEDGSNLKLQPWTTVQEDILKLLRTPANLDHGITLTHSPQLLQTLKMGTDILSFVHFSATTGEVFTAAGKKRQLNVWTLNKKTQAYPELAPHQKLKAVGDITAMTYIVQCRTYVGYCTDKTLRVFMDPVTGGEDIAYLVINHVIKCLVYNRKTSEIIAGGVGFLESYKVEGTQFKTKLQKAKHINAKLMKKEEVRDIKLDTRHNQIMVLSDFNVNVVNYENGEHTHLLVNRHGAALTSSCIYHDGEFLVTGSADGDLKIWNSVVYTQVHEFPGHVERVTAICCLPKDPILFSSSTDGTVFVWRMDTFQKFMKLAVGEPVCRMLVLKDGTLVTQTPEQILTYSLKQFYSTFATCNADIVLVKRLRGLGAQPDKILVSTEDGRLQMYNPVTGALVTSMLPLPRTQVLTSLAWSTTDSKMYAILRDGDVLVMSTLRNPFRALELWNAPEPQHKVTCLKIMNVSIGTDTGGTVDEAIIFMGTASGMLCVLEAKSVLMEAPEQAHSNGVICLECSCEVDPVNSCEKKSNRFLLSAGGDNMVKLWGLEFEPSQSGWILRMFMIQNIDCMGSPSHIAMIENVVCVAFGEYGLVKMFRLAGLTRAQHQSQLQGLYMLLTHFSQFDHSDTIWDTDNKLVKEMKFGQPINGVCFASPRGDLLIGFQSRVLLVPVTKYMPQYYLEKLSSKMFEDDEIESSMEITSKKKMWYDARLIPKYSTDLVARMTQKVKMKNRLTDEEAELLTLERMRSDLSTDSGFGTTDDSRRPSLTRENTTLSLNDALMREQSTASIRSDVSRSSNEEGSRSGSRKRSRAARKRPADFKDKDLRKAPIGEAVEEEEEDEREELTLNREDSLLYFKKPLSWLGKELTPSLLRDLEDAAQMTRYADQFLPDYLQPREDELPIEPERKKEPEFTEEQLKGLTPWERFLLTRKPIIAPDGYIPNSVVRKQIGYVKPQTPLAPWKLKPVPDADPRHLPEGYKLKNSGSNRPSREATQDEDFDLDNIMSMKGQSTLQRVKVQQSIKEASLYIGTAMCLLPDGTEPEGVPQFSWKTERDEVADLTPLARPRSEDATPIKEINVVTPVYVKNAGESPGGKSKFDFKTKVLKKVDIDVGSGLSIDFTGQRQQNRVSIMPPPLDIERSKSFRLSQAVSETPMEAPAEESESQKGSIGDGAPSESSPVPTEASTVKSEKTDKTQKAKQGARPGAKQAQKKTRPAARPKQPIAAPLPKLTKEEELTLLQKIVKEEWFPPDVPPLLDFVNDELTKLLTVTDTKVFTAVCDYLVQIFQQLSIAPKFLGRANDKLTKQFGSPSAIIRKKATWTFKQLGLTAKKENLANILPNLLTAAAGENGANASASDIMSGLTDLIGTGKQAKEGLANLMSSLGISKPLNTKEEQQAAMKAVSERLMAEAEKLRQGSADGARQRMEMWVSSLNLPQEKSYLSLGSRGRTGTELGSRGRIGYDETSEGSVTSSRSEKKSRQNTRGKRRKKRKGQKTSKGGTVDDNISVDTSVQTDPTSDKHLEDDGGETEDDGGSKRRRGRWRRGGFSEIKAGEDGTDIDETEGETEDEGKEEENQEQKEEKEVTEDQTGIEDEFRQLGSGMFTRIDYDLTPNMVRSETGCSEWSDDVPPLANPVSGRPKGASVSKFYERMDQVATSGGGSGSQLQLPSIKEPGRGQRRGGFCDPSEDRDSDLHSESNYTVMSKDTILRMPDGDSVVDSGIGRDYMSDGSSHVHGGSDSLYEQGRPKLSTIKSQSNLLKKDEAGEPEWKGFFSSKEVQERRGQKAVDFVSKPVQEETVIRIPTLPPIMYVDPEQPTLPGEAGLRLLHSIRLADKEKTLDPTGRVVEAVPGRLTITTKVDDHDGDTNYGLLRMHWTTQIPVNLPPALPYNSKVVAQTARVAHGEDLSDLQTFRSEVLALPRLIEKTDASIKQGIKKSTCREKTLPVIPVRERSDFQWSKPMAPAPKRSSFAFPDRDSLESSEYHCPQHKWASKKMHHYISSVKTQNPAKMDGRSQTFVASSLNDDVMSIISHSSVALMPSMTEKVMSSLNLFSNS